MYQHWWFSGRILAFHAGRPGSIPGQCVFAFSISYLFLFSRTSNKRTVIKCSVNFVYQHWWFSGTILESHAERSCSIPDHCIFTFCISYLLFFSGTSNKSILSKCSVNFVYKHWWFSGRILACNAEVPGVKSRRVHLSNLHFVLKERFEVLHKTIEKCN